MFHIVLCSPLVGFQNCLGIKKYSDYGNRSEKYFKMNVELAHVNPDDLKDLKERMKLIVAADEKQYHNEFSLKRFLRAFKTVDASFQVSLN